MLRQALQEKIKPVLMVNKIDRGILELLAEAETMYQTFVKVIENTNVIICTYESEDMGGLQVSPEVTLPFSHPFKQKNIYLIRI